MALKLNELIRSRPGLLVIHQTGLGPTLKTLAGLAIMVMEKYEYKMMFACTNDEGTRVWDMGEANNADLVTDFLNDQEVINMRREAGVDLESSEVLSMISKHKIW